MKNDDHILINCDGSYQCFRVEIEQIRNKKNGENNIRECHYRCVNSLHIIDRPTDTHGDDMFILRYVPHNWSRNFIEIHFFSVRFILRSFNLMANCFEVPK